MKISDAKLRELIQDQLGRKELSNLYETLGEAEDTARGTTTLQTGMSGKEGWTAMRKNLANKMSGLTKRWQVAYIVMLSDGLVDAFVGGGGPTKQQALMKAKQMGVDFSEEMSTEFTQMPDKEEEKKEEDK